MKIPLLGAYSKTWPLNCPKSDKIVRNFAEYLKKPGSNKGMASRPLFRQIAFKDAGSTGRMMWIWSGDTLMDLGRNQALKMTVKSIAGSDCLFVEAGDSVPKTSPSGRPGGL